MRSMCLYSFLGLMTCAGWSLAQTAPVPAVPEPVPSAGQVVEGAETAHPAPTALGGPTAPDPACALFNLPLNDGGPARFWLNGDYLLWRIPEQKLPLLVGTIPVASAELVQRLPDTTIAPLFGDGAGRLGSDVRSGLRLGAGLWLDDCRDFGVETSFFQLMEGRQTALFQSAAEAPLGIAFHDPVASQEVLIMDAVPGLRTGAVSIETSNRLWGAEINALARLPLERFPGRLDLIAGFRYLQFTEGLDVGSTSAVVPNGHLPCG